MNFSILQTKEYCHLFLRTPGQTKSKWLITVETVEKAVLKAVEYAKTFGCCSFSFCVTPHIATPAKAPAKVKAPAPVKAPDISKSWWFEQTLKEGGK